MGATDLLDHGSALSTVRNLQFDLDELMGFKSAMNFLGDVLGQPFLCNDDQGLECVTYRSEAFFLCVAKTHRSALSVGGNRILATHFHFGYRVFSSLSGHGKIKEQ